ncbi:MAG: hypothetical protein H7336_13460 [Bacteriovorax sp.]|nr:hypothetical protein [Bacteriovorax sp.]
MNIARIIQITFLAFALTSCASKPSRPSLYPNQTLKDHGDKYNVDIDECLKNSDVYLKTPEGERLQKSANSGSVSTSVGFGFGSFGSGIGLGVGSGDRGGSRLSGEEQVRRNFTNQCLVNKGYQVVGWEN